MQTSLKPLDLPEAPPLRYRPLPGLSCADYVEDHAHLIEASGAFDQLKYGAATLRLNKSELDLSGLAALASAFTTAIGKSVQGDAKRLRTLIVDHCQRFGVEVQTPDGNWLALTTDEVIDQHLGFIQQIDLVYALAGGVLRPLWSRLRSLVAEMPSESPKPSTSDTQES